MADDSVDYRNESAGGRDGGSGGTSDAGSPAGGVGARDTTPNRVLTTSGGRARVSRQVYSVSVARWLWEEAYCGDRVALEVVVLGYPPEVSADIDVIHVDENNAETVIETLSSTLRGGRIDAEWVAKGASADALSGRIVFRATISVVDNPIESSNAVALRRVFELPKTHCTSGRAHFDLTLALGAAKLESTVEFVKGWGGRRVKLGAAVPANTGGLIAGFRISGDWRWMKQVGVTNKFWNGESWQDLPTGFVLQNGNNYSTGFYRNEGHYVSQLGGEWPETFADYDIDSSTNRNKIRDWKDNIETTWTGKHYIKRRSCESTAAECCRFPVEAHVEILKRDAFASGTLIIANGNIRSNDSLWFLGEPRIAMAAHEFGHHLGNPDEYQTVRTDTSLNGDGAVNGVDPD
ncbi:MAG: hypothetical protein WBP29_12480, partial [Candidatus Zixiibacteriota bacterium]